MSEENKRLNEMLATVVAKYATLQSQLHDLMATSSSDGGSVSPSRKRKVEAATNPPATTTTMNYVANQMECTSSEDSCKRIREECKPKIAKVYVRTDPSDLSLVSFNSLLCIFFFFSNFSAYLKVLHDLQAQSLMLLLYLGRERWVPVEKIRAKGDER